MEVKVEIRDDAIVDAVRESVRAAYKVDLYGGTSGAGSREVVRQVNEWAKRQDYTAMIERMAPEIIRQVVASALEAAVKSEVKRQLKAMPPLIEAMRQE